MIELFDSSRLIIKRDHTLAALGGTLLLIVGVIAAYTAYLQRQLQGTQDRSQQLQAQLAGQDASARKGGAAANTSASPLATRVVDLQRQAEQLELEAALIQSPVNPATAQPVPTPAQWMVSLGALAQADTSLQKVDIERGGGARVEGLATSPQALNALVQAWEKDVGLAHLQPRSIDIKHEKSLVPFLRFQLRATPSPTQATGAGNDAAQSTGSGMQAAQP